MIPEISITSGADYTSVKNTFLEYSLLDPGHKKIKNTNNNNDKTYHKN